MLKEAKGLKFQGFVQPGDSLNVVASIKSESDSLTTLKVTGSVNGKQATSGRLVVDTFNLADREEGVDPAIDNYMNHQFRLTFRQLCNQLDPNNLTSMVTSLTPLGH